MRFTVITLLADGTIHRLQRVSSEHFSSEVRADIQRTFALMDRSVDRAANLVLAEHGGIAVQVVNGLTLPLLTALRESWTFEEPWARFERALYSYCMPGEALPYGMMAVVPGAPAGASPGEMRPVGDAHIAAVSTVYSHAIGTAAYDPARAILLFRCVTRVRPCAVLAWTGMPAASADEAHQDILCRIAPAIACVHLEAHEDVHA